MLPQLGLKIFLFLLLVCKFTFADQDNQKFLIEKISCQNRKSLHKLEDCGPIRDLLPFNENQQVSLDDIGLARTQLLLLPNFTEAELKLSKGSAPNRLQLILLIDRLETFRKKLTLGSSFKAREYQQRLQGLLTYESLLLPGQHSSLLLDGRRSLRQNNNSESLLRFELAKARLGENKTYFLISSFTNYNKDYQTSNTSNTSNVNSRLTDYAKQFQYKSSNTSIDLFTGKKIDTYNSFTLGLRHYLYSKIKYSRLNDKSDPNAAKLDSERSLKNTFIINYGFNSENDPQFATAGQRLDLGLIFTKTLVTSAQLFNTAAQNYDFNFAYSYHLRADSGGVWSVELGGNPDDYIPNLDDEFSVAIQYKDLFHGWSRPNDNVNFWYLKFGTNLEKIEKTQYNYHSFLGAKLGAHREIENFGDLDIYLFVSQLDGVTL
jgi:hypothetical protein